MKKSVLLISLSLLSFIASAQCNIDLLTVSIGGCQPTTNTYMASGTVEFTTVLATGNLTVTVDDGINTYDTIISPPFVSPQTYSISGIPSNGNATILTTHFSSDLSCTATLNYSAPASCSCIADVGTFIASTQTTSISPNVLVYEDTFTLTSNQDYTFAQEVSNSGGITYDPGMAYLAYTCAPTTSDPAMDPCFYGIVGMGNSFTSYNDANSINFTPFTPGLTFYYVPITMYNVTQNIYSVGIAPCFEMGTPISVLYLGPISTSAIISDPNIGEVNFDINGGQPEADASNFTISNIQPANATVNSTSIANNGNLVISGLNNTDIWSVDITDDAGSIIVMTNEYLSVATENNLEIVVFPNPAVNEIHINGITEPTTIEIYSISGTKVVQNQMTTDGQINITDLSKGTYTLIATSSRGTVTKMIVK